MNFNIYLDDVTGQQLVSAAEVAGESRNALIRKAISEWLARHAQPDWPDVVRDFKGMPDMREFEAERDRLKQPGNDPLS